MMIYINALAAALVYGGWAVFANFEHGAGAWLWPSLAHAVYAFFSTLIVTKTAVFIYERVGCAWRGILLGFMGSFVVMFFIPLVIHTALNTPDLWETILPGLIWGSGYVLVFLKLTDRKKQKIV
jgi:hypothetical protein